MQYQFIRNRRKCCSSQHTPASKPLKRSSVLMCLVPFILLSLSSSLVAREQLKAHTHGSARILIAIEANTVEIEFETPAVNLLGFEHAPSNTAQQDIVKQTREFLSTPNKVFNFAEARCELTASTVRIEGPAGESMSRKHEHNDDEKEAVAKDHDHNEHHEDEDHHNHDKHDKENHGAENDHEHASTAHSEIISTYSFNCSGSKKVTSVLIKLFDQFEGLQSIEANWITESKQGAADLSIDSALLELK